MINYNLMTTEEVAEKLRCSRHYVTFLRKQQAFGGFKIGRRWMYKENEVNNYIDRSLEAQLLESEGVPVHALNRRM